jgi:hypothetical protein
MEKTFTVSVEINILAQADAHIGTQIEEVTVETFSAHTKHYCEELQID